MLAQIKLVFHINVCKFMEVIVLVYAEFMKQLHRIYEYTDGLNKTYKIDMLINYY